MDEDRKTRLERAMAHSKAKGNVKLAEACAIALEADQTKLRAPKAA